MADESSIVQSKDSLTEERNAESVAMKREAPDESEVKLESELMLEDDIEVESSLTGTSVTLASRAHNLDKFMEHSPTVRSIGIECRPNTQDVSVQTEPINLSEISLDGSMIHRMDPSFTGAMISHSGVASKPEAADVTREKERAPPKKGADIKKASTVSPVRGQKSKPASDLDEIILISSEPVDCDAADFPVRVPPGTGQERFKITTTDAPGSEPDKGSSTPVISSAPVSEENDKPVLDSNQARKERAENRKRKREAEAAVKEVKGAKVSQCPPIEYLFQPDGRGIVLAASGPSILFELQGWSFCLNQGCPIATLLRTDLGNPRQIEMEFKGYRKVRYEQQQFSVYVVPVTLDEYVTCPDELQTILLQIFKDAETKERLLSCRFVKVKVKTGPTDSFAIKLVEDKDLVVDPIESFEIIEPRRLYRFLRQHKIVNTEAVWVSEQEPEPCNTLTVTEATVGIFVGANWSDIFPSNAVTVANYKSARNDEKLMYTMQASVNSMTAWGIDKAKKKPRDYVRSVPTMGTVLSWFDPGYLNAIIPILRRPHLLPLSTIQNQPMLMSLRATDLERSTLPKDCPPLDTRDANRTELIARFKIYQKLRLSGLLKIEIG